MPFTSKYILYNNEIVRNESFVLNLNNRSFKYGDALFETMHAYATKVQFLKDHIDRLKSSAGILKMLIPQYLNINNLEEKIHKLLDKNKIYQGARIRLVLFRNDGGLYTPNDNNSTIIIEAYPLEYNHYELNSTGLKIDVYKGILKPINLFSNLKTANALIYVMAGIFKTEIKVDDCIIFNDQSNVCEFISSNLFIAKNDIIYTPDLSDGCVSGIMRKNVIKIINGLKIKLKHIILTQDHIKEADEIFLTNAILGIQWVGAYKSKRFYNRISGTILQELNKKAF